MEGTPLRQFLGSEIGSEIVKAIEALPADAEIVTVSAGENMPITIAFVVGEGDDSGYIPEYAWTGESFREIGYL